jgi:hypothetical protein
MNAIISAATGYREADLQPFLRSVERACPDAKVFLVVYRRDFDHFEQLRKKYPFIEPIYVRRKVNRGGKVFRLVARCVIKDDYSKRGPLWNSAGRYALHIMLERFFFALDVVRSHRDSLENVLLTDSRDVVLQHDPFRCINGHMVSGREEKAIEDCDINSSWIKHVYGNEIYSSISKNKIVCAGVTLGPVDEVERYLAEMCSEIWRCLPKVALIAQFDQGIHNYLIYSGRVHVELTDNRSGIIASLHHESPGNIQTDASSGTVIVQGKPPAVMHQYDRHRNLVSFINSRLRT